MHVKYLLGLQVFESLILVMRALRHKRTKAVDFRDDYTLSCKKGNKQTACNALATQLAEQLHTHVDVVRARARVALSEIFFKFACNWQQLLADVDRVCTN